MSNAPQSAKILLYDIETAPNLSYTWGKWQQDVIAFEQEWYMLCFAYKWLGDKRTKVMALPDFKGYKKGSCDDKELAKELHKLFDEADVIIAHNGDSFDQKKAHTRFAVHKLGPASPYRQIDTCKVARKYFGFNSNKLDDLAQNLKIGKKLPTGGFSLWLGCMNNVKSAWDTMKRYNKQDVELLEKVYLELRPWIVNHPAMNLMEGRPEACPNCGGGPVIKQGTYWNKVTKVQVYKCKNCGKFPRSRIVDAVKEHVKYVG